MSSHFFQKMMDLKKVLDLSNLPKILASAQKINVDNKTRFRYLDISQIRLFELPHVGLWLNPKHNSHICIIYSGKSEFLSININ